MGLQVRMRTQLAILVVLPTVIVFPTVMTQGDVIEETILFLLLVAPSVAVISLIAGIIKGRRLGLISRKTAVMCAMAWSALTLLFFPFSSCSAPYQLPIYLLMCAGLGALGVLPFTSAVLALSRECADKPSPEKAPVHGIAWCGAACLVIAAIVIAFLTWMRWPSEPAWKAAFRAKGLPGSLEELDAWYTHLPPERNVALNYLAAAKDLGKANEWQGNETLHGLPGDYEWRRNEPIPPDTLAEMRALWDHMGRSVSLKVHEAARIQPQSARYPVDFTTGLWFQTSYLRKLLNLARVLRLEALLASIDGGEEGVLNAMSDTFTLANSLKEEPLLISQSVRYEIRDIAVNSFEDAVNRQVMSEAALARIQSMLRDETRPEEEERILNRALIGEQVSMLASLDPKTFYRNDIQAKGLVPSLTYACVAPVLDISGIYPLLRQGYAPVASAMESEEGAAVAIQRNKTRQAFSLFRYITNQANLTRVYQNKQSTLTDFELARTAAAVERYRLAHGRLPERLEELVPAFLDAVPRDPWSDGKPLSYKIMDSGEFVVSSLGPNRRDDLEGKAQAKCIDDLTFTVAPPEMRKRV
jgi:hypothetical protein